VSRNFGVSRRSQKVFWLQVSNISRHPQKYSMRRPGISRSISPPTSSLVHLSFGPSQDRLICRPQNRSISSLVDLSPGRPQGRSTYRSHAWSISALADLNVDRFADRNTDRSARPTLQIQENIWGSESAQFFSASDRF
jgi:hypothetical protein